jgi:hypothetical protein
LLLALALGGLALAPDMPAAVAAMAAAGAALTGVQTLTMARAAQVAMPEYMGRVAAFSLFAIGLGTAVGPPAGLLADAAGVRTGLLALAALALAAALAVSAWAARLAAAPD